MRPACPHQAWYRQDERPWLCRKLPGMRGNHDGQHCPERFMSLSPLASIHPEAVIGQGVTIDAFTTIQKDVVIGDGTWIGPNVTVMDGARIGKNCKVFPGAVISGIPQDLKFRGEKTTAEVGDNTTIRECVTL